MMFHAPHASHLLRTTGMKISVYIINTKLQPLDLVLDRRILIRILLIPSVLLVGNYLTLARVGIIMISLNHGNTYLTGTGMTVLQLEKKEYGHIPFHIFSQVTFIGIKAPLVGSMEIAIIGPRPSIQNGPHSDYIFG